MDEDTFDMIHEMVTIMKEAFERGRKTPANINVNHDVEAVICEKTFERNHELDEHGQKHTGGGHFKCELCQKYFETSHELDEHIILKMVCLGVSSVKNLSKLSMAWRGTS